MRRFKYQGIKFLGIIKEKIKIIVVEVKREEEIGQKLWVQLNNQKTQVRMGVIYEP